MADDAPNKTTTLRTDRDGYVLTITIDDAPWNRMGLEFMDSLEELVTKVASDREIRAVVVTGTDEKNFSVGMDLKQLPAGIERLGSPAAVFDQRLRVLRAIEDMRKPWIATLFGHCLGGGLELPLACHFRLAATEGAKIGLPEMDLGTVPAWGGSARLTRAVGRMHALDMILRGKKIDGPEALRIGLVNEIWPIGELKSRAHTLAQELASQPPLAVAGVLEAVVGSGDAPLDEGLAAERRAVLATLGSKDAHEGMMAFLEKRRPHFTGD